MAALFLIIILPHRRRHHYHHHHHHHHAVLQEIHSLFQCEFYKEYATSCIILQYLVSLKSSSRRLPLVPRLSVPAIPASIKGFQKEVPTQDVTKPVGLPSLHYT